MPDIHPMLFERIFSGAGEISLREDDETKGSCPFMFLLLLLYLCFFLFDCAKRGMPSSEQGKKKRKWSFALNLKPLSD